MNKEGKNGFSMSEGVIKNPLQSGPAINLSGGCGPPEPEPVLGKPVEKTLPDGSKEYNIALPKRSKDALCIIGCADSKDLAPFKEKEKYEFWGVNNLFLTQPIEQYPWTRWFEIHSITHDGRRFLRRGKPEFRGQKVNDYIEDLIKLKIPVYMQQFWPQIPNSVPYPLQAVLKAFGNYFTNTISYMLALGIAEGFKRIEVWGVDMAVDCLAPDSKVLTADLRWISGGDVKAGEELMGFDEFPATGKTRKWRKATVRQAREIERECFEVVLEDGTSFIASERHGWLTHGENVNRWKLTNQLLTKHHRIGRPTRILKMMDLWKDANNYDAGYLAGAFDGEGCLVNTPRKGMPGVYHTGLSFAQRENEMKETVEKLLGKFGFKTSFQRVNGGDTHQINIKGGKSEVMRFLGQIRPKRLLPKFAPETMGEFQRMKDVAVVELRPVGRRKVIGLEVDTKTFIVDGYATHNTEYFWQRPSCEYFLGIAQGRGIETFIPPEADLLKTRFLYGFQEIEDTAFRKKLNKTRASMEQRMAMAAQRRDHHMREYEQYVGAINTIKEMIKIWG